jgi:cell division protein FtsA
VFLSPIATASATLSEDEKELGCAMIDFGAGTTSVVVYYKNILRHVGVLPFGGETISKDIQDLKLSEQAAEKLKVKYGSAMEELAEDYCISVPAAGGKEGKMVDNKFLAGVIEARTEEILKYACGQIEMSGFADHVDEIVITGGASQLSNLTEKLKLHTGKNVRIGIPDQKVTSGMDEKYLNVEYAQLTGLLIHAEKSCITNDKGTKKKKRLIDKLRGLGDLFNDVFTEDTKFTEVQN